MDLALTETQEMLKTTARDFVKNELPWLKVKEIDETETGFSPEIWKKTADLGWQGVIFPEKYGGMEATLTDMAVICEEMGYGLTPGPYISSAILCGSLILEAGTDEQKDALLPDIISGDKILALAFTEPDFGWDAECIHLKAEKKGGSYVLNGTKRFVHDAMIADHLVVVARTKESGNFEDGITLFLVDKDAKGLSIRDLSGFVGEKLNEITFNSVEVPEATIIGAVDKGWEALSRPWDIANVLISAYIVGACQHLLDMTIEYAQTRIQFGRPIAAFQWVQGYIIEQCNYMERARWLTNEALWKLDSGRPKTECEESVALAKAMASEAFHECGHLAHEVHAGVGADKKYRLYLYSKMSKTYYSYLGDPAYHRNRVANILGL